MGRKIQEKEMVHLDYKSILDALSALTKYAGRENARIHLDTETEDYSDYTSTVAYVTWNREETAEEVTLRILKDRSAAQRQRESDLRQLAIIQARLEKDNG